MSRCQVATCPKCGEPIHASADWHKIVDPPLLQFTLELCTCTEHLQTVYKASTGII